MLVSGNLGKYLGNFKFSEAPGNIVPGHLRKTCFSDFGKACKHYKNISATLERTIA